MSLGPSRSHGPSDLLRSSLKNEAWGEKKKPFPVECVAAIGRKHQEIFASSWSCPGFVDSDTLGVIEGTRPESKGRSSEPSLDPSTGSSPRGRRLDRL